MDWTQGQFVEARAHLEQCLAISFSDEVAKDHSQTFVPHSRDEIVLDSK